MSLRNRANQAPAQKTAEKPAATTTTTTQPAAAPAKEDPPPAAKAAAAPAAAEHQSDWVDDTPGLNESEHEPVPRAGAEMGGDLEGLDLRNPNDTSGEFDATQVNSAKSPVTLDNDDGRVIEPAAATPAIRNENRSLATQMAGGMRQAQEDLAAAGYVTDTAFGAFPSFVLTNLGVFQCKDWSAVGLEKLTALHVVVVQVRRKWLYREKKERDARICYSYDNIPYPKNANAMDVNGNPVAAFTAKLEGEGANWESKLYYEALAVVVGGEGEGYQDHIEEMILVSMSPTSKTKWSGFVLQNKFMKKLMPHQYVTRLSRGPMMSAHDQNYYPMAYKFLRPADLSAFAAADGAAIVGDVAD